MISLLKIFEDDDITNMISKEQYFEDRTNYHISLVKKYLDKMINLKNSRLDNDILNYEKEIHDNSKFKNPEYLSYININWKYHLKDQGIDYQPGEEIERQMNDATFHHMKNNSHHPEAWDENLSKDNLNPKNRDKVPKKIVDATKMPLSYIACMVADWCAMSEEKDTCPYEWSDKNINKRWNFTDEQKDFIYELLGKIWKK